MRMRKENKGKSRKSWLLGLLLGAGLWMLSPQTAEAADVDVDVYITLDPGDGFESRELTEPVTLTQSTKLVNDMQIYTYNGEVELEYNDGETVREILTCSTSGGQDFLVSDNKIEFNGTELTEDDGMFRNEVNESYRLTLQVKIKPILSVHYKETENANPSLATDADIVYDYTKDVFSFTLSSPEKLRYDTTGRTFLNWKDDEETTYKAGDKVTKKLVDLDNIGRSRYEVTFTGNWEAIIDIEGPDTYDLVAGTRYRLCFGPCTVNSDGCTYSSGITFYVPSSRAYTFEYAYPSADAS